MHDNSPNIYGSLLCINEYGILCLRNQGNLHAVHCLSEQLRDPDYTFSYNRYFIINRHEPPF